MPLQAPIPDTTSYLIAGYVAFAVIFAVYLASYVIRRRNLEQDLKTLETLQSERSAPAPRQAALVKGRPSTRGAKTAARRPKPSKKRATRK